jgi:hypothetical protein
MKKFFFTIVLALMVTIGFSQTIIPKAGISLAKFGGSDVEDAKFNMGFTLGAGFNLPIGNGPISVQPELNYIQKGAKGDLEIEEITVSTKMKLNYIEVPVLVKATFGDATKFFINAGPSIGLGLSGKMKVESGGMSASVDVKFGEPKEGEEALYMEKRMDLGVQFGGGVIIADKVMVDIRYGLGLTDLNEDVSMKNNALQFTIGIPLSLK